MTNQQKKKWLLVLLAAAVLSAAGFFGWQRYLREQGDDGLVSGNGRIEAVEIDIAAQSPGRLKDVRVQQGHFVTTGQVIALMDTDMLEAQRRQAEAQLQQAQSAVVTANAQIAQRESDKAAAQAVWRSARRSSGRHARIFRGRRTSPQRASCRRRRLTASARGSRVRRRRKRLRVPTLQPWTRQSPARAPRWMGCSPRWPRHRPISNASSRTSTTPC